MDINTNINIKLHKWHKPRPSLITDNLKNTTLLLFSLPPHPKILLKGKQLLHAGRAVLQPRRTLPHALRWNIGNRQHGEDEREGCVLEFCGVAGEGEEVCSRGENFPCEGWGVLAVVFMFWVVRRGGGADVVD